jgi:serine palmitoyltransferase
MLTGSVANGLNSSGGFCTGSRFDGFVVDHQRINGTSFVFSAAVPALLAVSASEGINILRNTPSIMRHATGECACDLRGARLYRHALDPLARSLADHPHIPTYRDAVFVCCGCEGPRTPLPRLRAMYRRSTLLPRIASSRTFWTRCSRRARGSAAVGQGLIESRPSIRLAVTAALSRKECERAAGDIKAAVTKVLTKRK